MTAPRHVLVTGASSGIGRAIRDRLLAEGYQVTGVSRNPATDGTENERYRGIAIDLARTREVIPQLRRALADRPALDAAVSCAGAPAFGNLEQLSGEEIQAHLDLNLTSHVLVAHAVLPALKRRDVGHLVFIGSEAALRGGRRGSVYCAAKFGVRGLALALREECAGSGLHVSIVNPGMVRTPFFDDLDFAPGEEPTQALEPDDVADGVALILGARPGAVFDEIVLSPLHRVHRKRGARHSTDRGLAPDAGQE